MWSRRLGLPHSSVAPEIHVSVSSRAVKRLAEVLAKNLQVCVVMESEELRSHDLGCNRGILLETSVVIPGRFRFRTSGFGIT